MSFRRENKCPPYFGLAGCVVANFNQTKTSPRLSPMRPAWRAIGGSHTTRPRSSCSLSPPPLPSPGASLPKSGGFLYTTERGSKLDRVIPRSLFGWLFRDDTPCLSRIEHAADEGRMMGAMYAHVRVSCVFSRCFAVVTNRLQISY